MPTLKRQNFNPDHVMMHEKKDGTIPANYNSIIVKDIIDNSKIMALGKAEQMDGLEKKFQFFAKGPGAYWVGEGQKIKTSKAEVREATLRAKKLGVILLASREYLNYNQSDFFRIMAPKVAEAFEKKFDNAFILNEDNPFTQSIAGSAETAGNIIEGDLSFDNILEIEEKVTDNGYDVNGFISTNKNKSLLRKNAVRIENGATISLFDRATDTVDGIITENLNTEAMKRGTLVAGDFDYLRYGIPYPITYKISEEAQLSTITNEDQSPVNLFEQELIACRFTMDIGAMILSDKAFAMVKSKDASSAESGIETV